MSRISSAAVLALALMAGPLCAEPAAIVTLASAGDRVRTRNPDLAAARLRIHEALGRMRQAGKLSNPELETSLEHNPRFREGTFEVGFSQRFPVTDRLRLEKEISLTELKAAEAETLEVERQLTGQARGLIVQTLANRQRRELLREQAGLADTFARTLADIAAKGEGSGLDAGQAKLDAARLTLEARQLEAAEATLSGELKPLLGMRPGEPLEIGGNLADPAPPPSSADPSRRPDLQAAKLEALAAAQAVTLERARRYEDVEGGIFAAAERSEDAPEGYENEAMLGVRFKIPLPLWNKNEGAIEAAQARQRREELEAIALARRIALEAGSAREEMAVWARMAAEIDETLLPLAVRQAELTEEAFRAGQSELQSVIRARENRLQLAAARLDAVREYHLARVRHQTATGQR